MWTELLNRINFEGVPSPDLASLFRLHEFHVRSVPFENIDVQQKVPIRLELGHLYEKVAINKRGGFCYELNYLFFELLSEIGFNVNMISARVFDSDPGPEFDHLALLVVLADHLWLCDVGFGDLFVKPVMVIPDKVQSDGRNHFKLEEIEESWLLWMSSDGIEFEKKYQFSAISRSIVEFKDQCHFKQFSPESYFVKNTVVTLATENGRKTIFNEKYMVKENGERKDEKVEGAEHRRDILKKEFGINY